MDTVAESLELRVCSLVVPEHKRGVEQVQGGWCGRAVPVRWLCAERFVWFGSFDLFDLVGW